MPTSILEAKNWERIRYNMRKNSSHSRKSRSLLACVRQEKLFWTLVLYDMRMPGVFRWSFPLLCLVTPPDEVGAPIRATQPISASHLGVRQLGKKLHKGLVTFWWWRESKAVTTMYSRERVGPWDSTSHLLRVGQSLRGECSPADPENCPRTGKPPWGCCSPLETTARAGAFWRESLKYYYN